MDAMLLFLLAIHASEDVQPGAVPLHGTRITVAAGRREEWMHGRWEGEGGMEGWMVEGWKDGWLDGYRYS